MKATLELLKLNLTKDNTMIPKIPLEEVFYLKSKKNICVEDTNIFVDLTDKGKDYLLSFVQSQGYLSLDDAYKKEYYFFKSHFKKIDDINIINSVYLSNGEKLVRRNNYFISQTTGNVYQLVIN